MKKRSLVLFLVMVLVLSISLSACGNKKDNNNTEQGSENKNGTAGGGTLSVVVGPEPDTIDPALNSSSDGGTLCSHAFEGLTKLDTDGVSYVPGQAESWEISDDGLTYTFYLRDGLKWSDGSSLTAADFVYSWNRAVNPETAADYEYIFDVIEGYEKGNLNVTAENDTTLVVRLIAKTPYFLELCAFPTYFPVKQDIVEANPDGWSIDPGSYISNGPFKLTQWVHKSYMIFEKNENYWDKANVVPDSIKFVLTEDINAELAAFENGEILFMRDCPADEIKAQKEKSHFYMEEQLGTYYVSYNTQNEYLKDPLIRKALTLAIDRTFICEEILQAGQQPAGAFVSAGLTDADSSKEFREVGGEYYDPMDYEANLKEAKAALAEAGFPNGDGLPTFNYITNDGANHVKIAETIQTMWAQIGINLTIETQEWNTFLNTRKEGNYDIARNGWLADYNDPISFLDIWVTGSGNNHAQWSNGVYDELIKTAKTSNDPAIRMQAMHDAEDIIFDEWMLCPIYYYVDIYLLKEQVEGFYSSPFGFYFFIKAYMK